MQCYQTIPIYPNDSERNDILELLCYNIISYASAYGNMIILWMEVSQEIRVAWQRRRSWGTGGGGGVAPNNFDNLKIHNM